MLTQQSMIHGKYHGNTSYLLGNIDMGIQEFTDEQMLILLSMSSQSGKDAP